MGGGGGSNGAKELGTDQGGGGKGGGITVSMALSDASAATAPPQDVGRGEGDINSGGHAVKPVKVQQPTPELPQERNPSRENEGRPRSVNARRGSMVMGRSRRGAGASGTILTDPLGVGDNTGSTILG